MLRKLKNVFAKHSEESLISFEERRGSITLTITPAEGGKILEVSWFDDKTDKYVRKLHIITSEEDLGNQITKILTIEKLKQQ